MSAKWLFVVLSGLLICATTRTAARAATRPPLILRNSHFVLHTDLPPGEAERVLARMEAALDNAADYWKTRPRRQIDCYVVRDLSAWEDAALPHKLARVWIGGLGGATISEFESPHGKRRVKATVYASARPGIIEHEVVHAYCYQAFGEAGPDWYKEGMAQLISRPTDNLAIGCPRELTANLNRHCPKQIRDIVHAGRFTGEMNASFGAMLADDRASAEHISLNVWGHRDRELAKRMREHYRWSGVLCHLLMHNSNYSTRFRMLGDQYLADGKGSFDDAFAAVADQLAFEYRLFLKHGAAGYHVDLCRWDWHERFRTVDVGRTIVRRIQAARGFQASGLQVSRGQVYAYATHGKWATSALGAATTADGHTDGTGRIIGVVLTGLELSHPFELGAQGTFTAPASGNLYVRCNESWNQLSDNHGEIALRFPRSDCQRR